MTRITIDRPQAHPEAGPNIEPSTECIRMMTQATKSFSGLRMATC